MADFTPYQLDLTGLRVTDIVKVDMTAPGIVYEVAELTVREDIGGHDRDGNPLSIKTVVELRLAQPKRRGFESVAPTVISLVNLNRWNKVVINGLAYWVQSVQTHPGPRWQEWPQFIELELVRNPIDDPAEASQ